MDAKRRVLRLSVVCDMYGDVHGESGITCSDVIVTEIVREIMLETAAHLTPQTREAIRKELQFPPTAKKITKEERDALRVKQMEILREIFKT